MRIKVITSADITTLTLLANLNDNILTDGLTKDNREDLEILQDKLVELLIKLNK
jgi:hypothetical protein